MASRTYYERLLQPPKQSFFLFGMRGIGKSTWARHMYQDALYIDLLDQSRFHDYLRDPGLFAGELRSLQPGQWVVVDEVQRLPWLLNEVHRYMENHRLRFALLGSSARKLEQSGTNLLAGRALKRVMLPLLPAELGADFDLPEVLRYGSMPIVWQSAAKQETLVSYVHLYIKEEIQAEALVRNLPGFARFLPIAALFHGQTLNAAGLARDAGVARSTVMGFLQILIDTHLVWFLPAYEAKLRVKERKHPKLYWFDPGVLRAVRREMHPPGESEKGVLLEGWVAMLLYAYGEPGTGLGRQYDALHYWAPSQGGTEVDFLIRRGRDFAAVEVKAKSVLANRDLAGLRAITELGGVRRRLVVYLGRHAQKTHDGIEILPVALFQKELEEGRI